MLIIYINLSLEVKMSPGDKVLLGDKNVTG
jgi:hypothetical protein